MALAHRCPDGVTTRLRRAGPVGVVEGVVFTCRRCGYARSATRMLAEFEAVRPLVARLISRAP